MALFIFRKEGWIVEYLKQQGTTAEDLKSWAAANTLRQEGNVLFKSNQNDKALEKYDQVSFLSSWLQNRCLGRERSLVNFILSFPRHNYAFVACTSTIKKYG